MTQNQAILAHLKTKGPITPLEALREYGCFRLGARIWDLKRDGHSILSERVKVGKDRFVARYTYLGAPS